MEVKPGWLYSGPKRGEFGMGWYVPVLGSDRTFTLIDSNTFNIPNRKNGESGTDAAIRVAIEMGEKDCQYTINRVKWDYHHGSVYEFPCPSGELPECMEPVCDLHEMRGLNGGEEARFFDNENVVRGVQLYKEHGYSWSHGPVGVALVRKGAEPNALLKLNAAMDDTMRSMNFPRKGYDWILDAAMKEVEAAGLEPSQAQTDRIAFVRLLNKMLAEMDAKIDKVCRENSNRAVRTRIGEKDERENAGR